MDDELSYHLVRWAFSSRLPDGLPLWLVSSIQASIDIHSTLNGRTSNGLKVLVKTITETDKSMDTCLKVLCGRSDDVKAMWFTPHEWFSRPFIPKPIGRLLESDLTVDGCSLSAVAELIPSITALISLHLRCNALSFGIAVTDVRASILALAHLYKAAQHYGLVPLPWADLDFVLENFVARQRGSNIVQPIMTQVNPNADSYAMARHFRMTLGLSAAQRERSARPKLHGFEPYGSDCRQLKPRSALLNAFMDRLSKGTPEHREDLECLVIRVLEQEKTRVRKTKKPPTSGARSSFTPLSLLEGLEKRLVHLETVLNFDLMLFSCDCACMLLTLDQQFRPGSQRLPKDFARTPHDFVDGLLWSVADTVHIAQPRNPAELKRVVQ